MRVARARPSIRIRLGLAAAQVPVEHARSFARPGGVPIRAHASWAAAVQVRVRVGFGLTASAWIAVRWQVCVAMAASTVIPAAAAAAADRVSSTTATFSPRDNRSPSGSVLSVSVGAGAAPPPWIRFALGEIHLDVGRRQAHIGPRAHRPCDGP